MEKLEIYKHPEVMGQGKGWEQGRDEQKGQTGTSVIVSTTKIK